MKILFIIQGEGRGHLTQALSLRQKLTDEGHQVVAGGLKQRGITAWTSGKYRRSMRSSASNYFFKK